METTGFKIKRLRQEKNLKQSELAEKIGLTHSQISSIELGKSEGSKPTLKKIAEFFEVSYESLVNSESEENRKAAIKNANEYENLEYEYRFLQERFASVENHFVDSIEWLKKENERLWMMISKLTNDPSFCVGNDQNALQECKVITLLDTDLKSVA